MVFERGVGVRGHLISNTIHMNKNSAISLLRRTYGNGYNLRNSNKGKYFVIRHANSGAYVLIDYKNPHRIKLLEGETPNGRRGKGIGTKLRALVTLFSNLVQIPITQYGEWFMNKRPGNTNNRPPTTRILRNRLGWKPRNNVGKYHSIFDPSRNNISFARGVLQ
jgi:hypothetical protein